MECILEQAPQLSQVSILIRQDPTIQIQTNVSNTPPYLASSLSSGTLSIFTVGHGQKTIGYDRSAGCLLYTSPSPRDRG